MGLGYMSEASIGGTYVLATGSSISPSFENIVSNGVRGAGYLQAGPSVFAWDYPKWEGSLEWDLGTEGGWGKVTGPAVNNRSQDLSIMAKPGGSYEMNITGKCSSLSGSTSSGSLVNMSVGVLGIGDDGGSISGQGGAGTERPLGGRSEWCDPNSVIPYWMTSATMSSGGGCATDWNFQINNSVIPILCCKGESGTHYNPTTILLGPTTATASATFWDGGLPSDFWSLNQSVTINLSVGSVTITGRITSTECAIQTGESIVGAGITVEGVACEKGCVEIS